MQKWIKLHNGSAQWVENLRFKSVVNKICVNLPLFLWDLAK